MFMKLESEKVTVKGGGYTDGRKQKDWIYKEDISSPTVSTEGLMLSCMIDAMEFQEVATADISGAYLQTDYDKGDIHIKPEEAMVTLLEDIYLEYYNYLSTQINVEGNACMQKPRRLSMEP